MKPKTKPKILKFPQGFLWGAATSAYQVEGGITNNDWANSPMPQAGQACDHYNRYKDDFKLAKKLNHSAHRLSLEWSRIEPAKDEWDEEALHHYFHVLKFLKEQGFTTFVTLHHFTNPLWFVREGGWTRAGAIEDFLSFVSKVAQSLGQFVDFWITINEPSIAAFYGYWTGIWPPFEKNWPKAIRVYRQMLFAHNRAYELLHAYYPQAQVGLAHGMTFNEPLRKQNILDKLLVKIVNYLGADYPLARTKCDFIGVNYYLHNVLRFGSLKALPPRRGAELTDKGWEIFPESLHQVLLVLKKFQKPIYITENGLADARDTKRAGYIASYLREVYRAIRGGVDVRGYLYWSLLDNYEWPVERQEKTGFEMKFGLVAVDFATQKRKVRKSARFYAAICKNNALMI